MGYKDPPGFKYQGEGERRVKGAAVVIFLVTTLASACAVVGMVVLGGLSGLGGSGK